MPGSLIDMLPPEAQNVLGAGALVVTLLGLLLWIAGIRIARPAVAILFGAGTAALGAWLAPTLLGFQSLSGALVGFAVGVLAGALGFRLLQGITLAACLGVAVTGAYYRWHVQIPPGVAQAAAKPQSIPASDLLIKGPLAGAAKAAGKGNAAAVEDFVQRLLGRWNTIPSKDQAHLLIAGLGTAAVVLLLAFAFARQTTWVATAALGTMMLFAGGDALTHLYAPQWQFPIPLAHLWGGWRYASLVAVTLLGMLIQWHFFWPGHHRKKKKPASSDSKQ